MPDKQSQLLERDDLDFGFIVLLLYRMFFTR